MNNYLKASLDAFNVSKNCDRSTAESFYDSYIERKKKIIAGKVSAAREGKPINEKKLRWELTCLKEVQEQKKGVLLYIDILLHRSTNINSNLIEQAENLIKEEPAHGK